MTNSSEGSDPAAVPLFTYLVDRTARSLALTEKPKWRFPCGLCNAGTVAEPGALCGDCAPVAKPTNKPRKRSAKTTTKRVPPWERVAEQPDDQGQPRRGKRGES